MYIREDDGDTLGVLQLNVTFSRLPFDPAAQNLRLEAIAEGFNLFNARNPSGFGPAMQFRDPLIGADGQATPIANFLRPTSYTGDFQEPEQRVGQIGFRIMF